MSERKNIQGEYISLTLAILNALEERDLKKAALLLKKRKIFDLDTSRASYTLRKMEAAIFEHLTYTPPSWMEALLCYQELAENRPRPEAISFFWRG